MKRSETRTEHIHMRLTAAEKAQIEVAALLADRPTNEWARRILLIASDMRKKRKK